MDKTPAKNKDMSWKSFFLSGCYCPFRVFVIEPHSVSGSSMDETFHTSDYVLVDKISYVFTDPKRGDVIVFNPPVESRETDRFIKRIIGIPGDVIQVTGTETLVNGEKVSEDFVTHPSSRIAQTTLKEGEYFVMGDNRAVSYDSRAWGSLKKEHIQGRVVMRLYPFNQIDIFPGAIK